MADFIRTVAHALATVSWLVVVGGTYRALWKREDALIRRHRAQIDRVHAEEAERYGDNHRGEIYRQSAQATEECADDDAKGAKFWAIAAAASLIVASVLYIGFRVHPFMESKPNYSDYPDFDE
jgi:hypothetical protein